MGNLIASLDYMLLVVAVVVVFVVVVVVVVVSRSESMWETPGNKL